MPGLHNDHPDALAEVFRHMSDSELLQEWEKWKIIADVTGMISAVRVELERHGLPAEIPDFLCSES